MNEAQASNAACCADFYGQDWVRTLLGDSFHPGGLGLSQRLIESLELKRGARVLDLACGTGTTAIWLAQNYDVEVVGLDFGEGNLARATSRARDAGLDESRIRFVQGDANSLPFDDNSFDAALCECAVSTFGDKEAVLRQLTRVIGPGGHFALSDMEKNAELPTDLELLVAPWACLAEALTADGYRKLLLEAGFEAKEAADESGALQEMNLDLKKKLLAAALGQLAGVVESLPMPLPDAIKMLARAKELVTRGDVSYLRLSGTLPGQARLFGGSSAARETPLAAPATPACDPTTGCC